MSGATLAKVVGGTCGGLSPPIEHIHNGSKVLPTGAVELKETTGGGGRALKLQTDSPHLVSLGGNRFSTAVTVHPIPPGRVTLGSGKGVDIHVQGTGVQPLHCNIENDHGVVTLYPLSENLAIDGIKVTKPTRLTQGVMLTIGRSNCLRFNHPEEAKLIKSVLPNTRISMTPIKFDVDVTEMDDLEGKYEKKPPSIPRKVQQTSLPSTEQPISSIQMKVSKFEYLAAQNFKKSISPKVFSSNLITVNTPAKDVLGKAPPDLQDFAKNLPQSALNYSDSCFNDDKQKNKTPDRQFFGRKSPHQYVNVAINESKTINNRVVLFENGKKEVNTNKLVNWNQNVEKLSNTNNLYQDSNISGNYRNLPSQKFSPEMRNNNTLSTVRHRSITPSPSSNNNLKKQLHRRSGSLGELFENNGNIFCVSGSLDDIAQRNNDAEMKRNKAQIDRIREQEIERAEQARLEEILTMCAEYEKQVQWERNNKISTPNRIKTNGSLPRDKRQCLTTPNNSYGVPSPTSSPLSLSSSKSNDSKVFSFDGSEPNSFSSSGNHLSPNYFYENVTNSTPNRRLHYENVEIIRDNRAKDCGSMYENVYVTQQNNIQTYPQSPRTRIKTIPCITSKECSPKDHNMDLIENKFPSPERERQKETDKLLENIEDSVKVSPQKTILPFLSPKESSGSEEASNIPYVKREINKEKLESLKSEKQKVLASMAVIRRKMSEIEMQEEELNRELEMEKALIAGEHKSKMFELQEMETRKQILLNRAHEVESKMEDCQKSQAAHQENCKQRLAKAQEAFNEIEKQLSEVNKHSPEYNSIFEKYLESQEVLDNERKVFEDLEFHQLEEEANWLACREEIQREIVELSQQMEIVQSQIFDLEKQKVETSRNNSQEFDTLEVQMMEYSKALEEHRHRLREVENELNSAVSRDESDQEFTSESDGEVELRNENRPTFDAIQNLSFSMIETNSAKKQYEDMSNMSQSFNEKMLQEKSILDVRATGKKFPSQDDIDRISKVTLDAPMNIDGSRGSLGKKTIESLKEIERNRQLHLVQQGSQVIEQERRRVLELKQRVQEEVRSQWAQRSKMDNSLTIFEGKHISITNNDDSLKQNGVSFKNASETPINEHRTKSAPEVAESPTRPLSESSDFSVEGAGTFGRRRQLPDKTRPLTRYLPIRSSELDLRQHIESAGHQVVLCPHVLINSYSCRGFLHKRGSKLNNWSRRWFVFDRNKHTLTYYIDKSEKKPRGGAYFQAIEEVYLDHSNSMKSPNPQLTFIVKTHERCYYLMAPSPEAMRIWIDVIFTGAEGYREFEHGT
ncbi:uncharacterized protein LOC108737526 [Agrilus planipennis]|uniref:Uncharacterized protein LOC108737526 n=1 Tax=Agrilus planipennis TaxID=224129 RepID=A0A1W4WPQ6_AGRPL|nr:uncharacterized protein LOC108737526 [Agrilus planipennis]